MTDNPKITKIGDARKRMNGEKKDKRSGASSGRKGGGSGGGQSGYERAMRKQKGGAGQFAGGGVIRWYHYLQLALFLALVTWFMRSCSI